MHDGVFEVASQLYPPAAAHIAESYSRTEEKERDRWWDHVGLFRESRVHRVGRVGAVPLVCWESIPTGDRLCHRSRPYTNSALYLGDIGLPLPLGYQISPQHTPTTMVGQTQTEDLRLGIKKRKLQQRHGACDTCRRRKG